GRHRFLEGTGLTRALATDGPKSPWAPGPFPMTDARPLKPHRWFEGFYDCADRAWVLPPADPSPGFGLSRQQTAEQDRGRELPNWCPGEAGDDRARLDRWCPGCGAGRGIA